MQKMTVLFKGKNVKVVAVNMNCCTSSPAAAK